MVFIFNLVEINFFDKYLHNKFCIAGTMLDIRNFRVRVAGIIPKKKRTSCCMSQHK